MIQVLTVALIIAEAVVKIVIHTSKNSKYIY